MPPAISADLRRVAFILAAAMIAGAVLGSVLAGLAAGLVLVLGLQFRELWLLHRWVHRNGERPVRRLGLLGDVSNRLDRLQRQARKRKKRLRKSVQRFRQASEANPDGAVMLEADGRIEWLNRSAGRLLGLKPAQDTGQIISNLVRHPRFAAWFDGDPAREPFEMDSPAAEGQRLLLRVVPFGESRRMLLVRDITRLHTLEQMRRDFVANVSHELRSPLTVVMGDLEIMSGDTDLPDGWRRPVARMTEQAARMSRIVEDLLRLSRIESDPGGAARQPVQVADMIAAILRDAARLSTSRHEMIVEADPSLILLGDYGELYSALSNIVFNAVQYTPAGGRVTVRWLALEEGACCEVEDTGVGIEAHHIPRLTERFYRVDKARSRELGGTGLGLAIVKHALMRHDAGLHVTSEPGEGSTFRCVFPADRVQRIERDAAGDAAAEDSGGERGLSAAL